MKTFLLGVLLLAGCAEVPAPHGDECEKVNVFLIGTRVGIGYLYDCETKSIYRELDKFNARQWLECDASGNCVVYKGSMPPAIPPKEKP